MVHKCVYLYQYKSPRSVHIHAKKSLLQQSPEQELLCFYLTRGLSPCEPSN